MNKINTKDNKSLENIKLGLDEIIACFALISFFVTFLHLFIKLPDCILEGELEDELRLLASASMFVSFLLMRLFSNTLVAAKGKGTLLLVLIGAAAYIVNVITDDPNSAMACVLTVLSAVGLSCMTSIVFTFCCNQSKKDTYPLVFIAFIASMIVFLLIGSFQPEGRMVANVIFAILGPCLLLILHRIKPSSVVPVIVTTAESKKRSKIEWRSALMLTVIYFEIGFLLVMPSLGQECFLACTLTAIIVALLLLMDHFSVAFVNERSIARLTIPLTVTAFVIMFLGDTLLTTVVALVILTALCVTYWLFGYFAIAEHVRISSLSSLYTISQARSYDYIGLTLGILAGSATSYLLSYNAEQASIFTIIIGLLYCFIASQCHVPRFPEHSMELDAHASSQSESLWEKRCFALSEECGLSDRQREILILIAQGRNAKYIEKALMISLSTAQTHIRNIYRRTGVHSRQELLDLIEKTKLYGED